VITFLSWDWREGISGERMAKAIAEFAGGPVYAAAVDTGTEDYVVALSTTQISPDQARELWDAAAADDYPEAG
jgi:hypothetical protein